MTINNDKTISQDLNANNTAQEDINNDGNYSDDMSEHLDTIDTFYGSAPIKLETPTNDNFPSVNKNGFATTNDNLQSPYYSLGDGAD